jgi:hypothetical protein
MNWYAVWVLATLATFAFIAPSIVAIAREVPNQASVIVINLLLGATVIGWIVALAMAVRSKPTGANATVAPGMYR